MNERFFLTKVSKRRRQKKKISSPRALFCLCAGFNLIISELSSSSGLDPLPSPQKMRVSAEPATTNTKSTPPTVTTTHMAPPVVNTTHCQHHPPSPPPPITITHCHHHPASTPNQHHLPLIPPTISITHYQYYPPSTPPTPNTSHHQHHIQYHPSTAIRTICHSCTLSCPRDGLEVIFISCGCHNKISQTWGFKQ